MVDILFRLIMGHMMGDYLFQNNWMALNKKNKKIAAPILVHCFVYTLCVMLWLLPELRNNGLIMNYCVFAFIFMSHFIFDRFQIIEGWLTLIKSRNYKQIGEQAKEVLSVPMVPTEDNITKVMYLEFNVAYTALVMTIADNTAHLICMYFILKYTIGL